MPLHYLWGGGAGWAGAATRTTSAGGCGLPQPCCDKGREREAQQQLSQRSFDNVGGEREQTVHAATHDQCCNHQKLENVEQEVRVHGGQLCVSAVTRRNVMNDAR